MFQAEIIRLTIENRPSSGNEGIERRISELEKKISSGEIIIPKEQSSPKEKGVKTEEKTVSKNSTSKAQVKANSNSNLANVTSTEYWPKVLGNLKKNGMPQLFAVLANTKAVELNDMQLGIVGVNTMGSMMLKNPDNNEKLRKAVFEESGKDMMIKVEEIKNVIDKQKQTNFDIPINIIDE